MHLGVRPVPVSGMTRVVGQGALFGRQPPKRAANQWPGPWISNGQHATRLTIYREAWPQPALHRIKGLRRKKRRYRDRFEFNQPTRARQLLLARPSGARPGRRAVNELAFGLGCSHSIEEAAASNRARGVPPRTRRGRGVAGRRVRAGRASTTHQGGTVRVVVDRSIVLCAYLAFD